MKNAVALTLAAFAIAGCSASGDTMPGLFRIATAPHVTAPGTSSISPGKQPAFCQDQVAYTYDAQPQDVTTHERVVAADGGATIDVTVENEGVKTFKCRFDDSNRFIDVMATTSAEAL
jgi:hypothetical protein